MDMVVTDFSDGTLKTNYWQSDWAHEGVIYCVIHAKTLHLLMPTSGLRRGDPIGTVKNEAATGKKVVISKVPDKSVWRLMFDDDTETPYSIWLDERQFANLPAPTDKGRTDVRVTAHYADGSTQDWPATIE